MMRPMGVRPAPATTDLLEVLDRALGGGISIDMGRTPQVTGLALPAKAVRVVVGALETYLQHIAPEEPPRASALPLNESRRSV